MEDEQHELDEYKSKCGLWQQWMERAGAGIQSGLIFSTHNFDWAKDDI